MHVGLPLKEGNIYIYIIKSQWMLSNSLPHNKCSAVSKVTVKGRQTVLRFIASQNG